MVIVTDFDSVMNYLLEAWLIKLNSTYNLNVQYEDVVNWDMQLAYPTLTPEQIYEPLSQEMFWKNVPPQYDAIYYIQKLIEDGHKIYVCTATKYTNIVAKFDNCLFRYFSFLNYKDIIIMHNKSLLDCDIIIDDYWENIKNSKAIKLLKDAPYNRDIKDMDFRVHTWKEIYDIITQLNNKK